MKRTVSLSQTFQDIGNDPKAILEFHGIDHQELI